MPGVQPARTQAEVDNRIELWHSLPDEEYEALGKPGLNDYLGWSEAEYARWFRFGVIPI